MAAAATVSLSWHTPLIVAKPRASHPASKRRVAQGSASAEPSRDNQHHCNASLPRRDLLLAAAAVLACAQTPAASGAAVPPPVDKRDTKERRYEGRKDVTTPAGVRYLDIVEGTGEAVERGDVAVVHYSSRLLGFNGKNLDSSYDHIVDGFPEPFEFRIGDGNVIAGLSDLVTGMKVGGKRRGILPPALVYQSVYDQPLVVGFDRVRRLEAVIGNSNRDASMVFDVELLKKK
eukprot:jgi/Chlat1/2072/Chrsp17S02541